MSRAFVKDGAENDGVDSRPDRPIDDARNLVTARGLQLIEGNVARYRDHASKATTAADRTAIARASRELRCWSARLANAEIAEPDPAIEQVVFGVAVTLRLSEDRAVRRYRSIRAEPKCTFEPTGGSFSGAFLVQIDDEAEVAVAALKHSAI